VAIQETQPILPTEEEALGWAQSLSNWGRWGADDQRGTLNLITDEKRLEALRLVRHGRSVSFAWDIDTQPPGPDVKLPPQRYMVKSGQGVTEGDHPERQVAAAEFLGLIYHGRRITHLDALSHVFWNGRMYNDFPAALVTTEHGAKSHSVTVAREGIITRGVLVDAPRHRGVPWLDPGTPVHRHEVEAILDADGVEVREGDALLLRTGYGRSRIENGPKYDGTQAGWGASCLPLFHERGVAVIAADTSQETHPSGFKGFRGPIHGIGIAAMGLWLLDNCNLEALAETCNELGVHEFAVVLAPIPFVGATGSPMNPLALF
jgi:kynurenine formamidase